MKMNYVLFGEEQYRQRATIKNIVAEYASDEQDLNVIRYDALQNDLSTILEDAMTIPFFSDYKIILVYHATFLSTNNDTSIDANDLAKYIDQPSDSTILVLIGEFAKLDSRKKVVKQIKGDTNWRVVEFRKLDEVGKQSYLQEEIKRRNLQIDKHAMKELLERLPLDMEIIHTEMEKLELYGGNITQEIVQQLVTKQLEEDVFQLVNAVVERDVRKAFHIWQDLRVVNTDAIYLIALLAGQFRFLYEIKVMMMKGMGKDEITSTLNAHPYRVKLSMESADRLNVSYVLEILAKLATLDQKLKGGLLDKRLGFEMFLLEM